MGWVSVSDELPPINVYVLGFCDAGVKVCKRGRCGNGVKGVSGPHWAWSLSGNPSRKNVSYITHWMPLPETPVRQS